MYPEKLFYIVVVIMLLIDFGLYGNLEEQKSSKRYFTSLIFTGDVTFFIVITFFEKIRILLLLHFFVV